MALASNPSSKADITVESNGFFGFPVHIEIMFTQYCNLFIKCAVALCPSFFFLHSLIKKYFTAKKKNANYHMSF